jgi:hypothetical protein
MGILKGMMNVECRMQKRNPARQLDCFFILHSAFFLCVLDRQFLFLLQFASFAHDVRNHNDKKSTNDPR